MHMPGPCGCFCGPAAARARRCHASSLQRTGTDLLLTASPCAALLPARLAAPASTCPQVTQLGHVKDLATAFVKILGNPKAAHQVYNLAGER